MKISELVCSIMVGLSIVCACMGDREFTVVRMSDFGLDARHTEDICSKVSVALDYCRTLDTPVKLVFDKAVYPVFFDGDEALESSQDRQILYMDGFKDVIVDGGGSTFLFSGLGGVALLYRCSNVELRNFTVEWERPFITQTEIRECAPDHLDLFIDPQLYPYELRDSHVVYIFPNGEYGVARDSYNNCFTPDGEILPGVADNYQLCQLLESEAEQLPGSIVRFHGENPLDVPAGTIMTIYNVRYRTPWASLVRSSDLRLRDIVVHHSVGCGVVATDVRDLSIDRVDYRPSKGRVFTAVADAFHITNCSGQFSLTNCYVDGQGDDALNVHGRYFKALSRTSHSSEVYLSHTIPLVYPGDSVWVVDRRSMSREDTLLVAGVDVLGDSRYRLSFASPLPEDIPMEDLFFENASRYPDVLVRGNTFGKGNRARGILLTTPGHVLVEDNVFRSAGCAILVEGDLTYWYESGGVRDMTIRNNRFERCLTSPWGAAVISFTPSPEPVVDAESYHSNVRIENNLVTLAEGTSFVYDRMVGNLTVTDNEIR